MLLFTTRKFSKILKKNGFIFIRSRGSHLIFKNAKGEIACIYTAKQEIKASITSNIIKSYNLKL